MARRTAAAVAGGRSRANGRESPVASVEIEVEAPQESEEERVLEWRLESLRRAGYDDVLAVELALLRDVDLHRAIALLRNGCTPQTARRILV